MVEGLSVFKRRARIGNLCFVGLTKQRENITGSSSEVLLTPTEGKVLKVKRTLKNLSVPGFGDTFCFSTWLLRASPFGAGHIIIGLLFQ